MTRQKWSNNARTVVTGTINHSDTSISVEDSSKFTSLGVNEFEVVTISNGSLNEIVRVTSRSGNTWQVLRGQEGTLAREWQEGSIVESRLTAGSLSRLSQVEFDVSTLPNIMVSSENPISAIGPSSNVENNTESTAVGFRNTSSGVKSNSFGNDNLSYMNNSLAVGSENQSMHISSVAIGKSNTANNQSAVAIGTSNSARGNNSISIGTDNSTSGEKCIAAGSTNTSRSGSITLGESNTANTGSLESILLGKSNQTNKNHTILIGTGNEITGGESISIGHTNTSSKNTTITIGKLNVNSGLESVLIGSQCTASGDYSIGVGSRCSSVGEGSISLGKDSKSVGENQFNMMAIPTSQPSSELGGLNPTLFLSTQETILLTPDFDMKVNNNTFSLNMPVGSKFFISEIGFISKFVDTVTIHPEVKIGNNVIDNLFIDGMEITSIQPGVRRLLTEVEESVGVTVITIKLTKNASAMDFVGQFYFKGFAVAA